MPRTTEGAGARERLRSFGPEALDDVELLTLLLRTGTRGRPAHALARELLGVEGLHGLARTLPSELERHPGVGPAKAASLIAAFMLEASATPLPAMSKAVPWSTDVRIIGSPKVTFTDAPNDSALTAIVAWS